MSQNKQLVASLQIALGNWRADPSPDAFAKLCFAAGCVSGAVYALERELELVQDKITELELGATPKEAQR